MEGGSAENAGAIASIFEERTIVWSIFLPAMH